MNFKTKIGTLFISALRQEAKFLLRQLPQILLSSETGDSPKTGPSVFPEAVFICGVGGIQATAAIKQLLNEYSISTVFILGWCGSLTDRYTVGDIVLISSAVCTRSKSFPSLGSSKQLNDVCCEAAAKLKRPLNKENLVTSDEVVCSNTVRDNLRSLFDASVVDMETWYLLNELATYHIPAAVLRVVSDSADDRIGLDLNKIPLTRAGRLAFLIQHPAAAAHLNRIRRQLKSASYSLDAVAEQLLEIVRKST